MKKILLLLPLLLLTLVGCKVKVIANMYELTYGHYDQEVKDYKYELLNTYEDYQQNQNHKYLHQYEEDYFNNHVLIIIVFLDSAMGHRYGLKEVIQVNRKLIVNVEYLEYGLSTALCTSLYCVEVEAKGIKKVEVNRIK